MQLRPITYELLVFARNAVSSAFAQEQESLPKGRQRLEKAMAWLVAAAVGAQLIAPDAAERVGKRLLAAAQKAAAREELLRDTYDNYPEIETPPEPEPKAEKRPITIWGCETCGHMPVEVQLTVDQVSNARVELWKIEGERRERARWERLEEIWEGETRALDELLTAAEAEKERQQGEIDQLKGQIVALKWFIYRFMGSWDGNHGSPGSVAAGSSHHSSP
jgi:hypothetical protein